MDLKETERCRAVVTDKADQDEGSPGKRKD